MKIRLNIIFLFTAFASLTCCNPESKELNKSADSLYINQREILADNNVDSLKFSSFWEQFRMAIVNSNYEELKRMTRFPLILEGFEDSDPVVKTNDDSFKEIFEYYLDHQTIYYKDSSYAKRDLFWNLTSLTNFKDYFESDSLASVEYLNFTKTGSGWKLSKIYINTKEINK